MRNLVLAALPLALANAICICTMDYRPVCAPDGETYSNACRAKCENDSWSDSQLQKGPCSKKPSPGGGGMCDKGCVSWYDGCNTCGCSNGKLTFCTKKFCLQKGEAKCVKYGAGGGGDDKDDGLEQGKCPKDCTSWYDGCNRCSCSNGNVGRCTRMACKQKGQPKCMDKQEPSCEDEGMCCPKSYNCMMPRGGNKKACVGPTDGIAKPMKCGGDGGQKGCPKGCLQWNDGCNDCQCLENGMMKCTKKACLQKGKPMCKRWGGKDGDVCSLPRAPGPCRAAIPRFFFDGEKCARFTYGGCQGNGNNFTSMDQCQAKCGKDSESESESDEKDICSLPKAAGMCMAAFRRYYFDGEKCTQFIYGGCQGNENNFTSMDQCQAKCGKDEVDVCKQPKKTGPCEAAFTRYYFDGEKCSEFTYGGCQANGNNFQSMDQCKAKCGGGGGEKVDCKKLDVKSGECGKRDDCEAKGKKCKTKKVKKKKCKQLKNYDDCNAREDCKAKMKKGKKGKPAKFQKCANAKKK